MDKFKTVLNFANEQSYLGYGIVTLITFGGEKIFSIVVFSCPCSHLNFLYGFVFLLVPALALLLLGYILSKKTWKLFTGFCLYKAKLCCWKRLVATSIAFIQISTTALVAPSSWIAFALLNGRYFECAMTGTNVSIYAKHLCRDKESLINCQEELYKFPCGGGSTITQADQDDVLLTLRAQSQILGWLVIAFIMLFNLLLSCLARCASPISYLQLKFWKAYALQESCMMESYTEKHAKELAERNLKSFFNQKQPESIITPSKKDWEKISSLYKFNTKKQYYSTLHKFVEKGRKTSTEMMGMDSIKSTGPPANNPAVLYFVDDGRMAL